MTRRKRRTRDERQSEQERWNPGLLHLATAALALSLIASLALRSDAGRQLGLAGAYVWVTALLVAFFLRLVHLARFLLPPEAEHLGTKGWQEGLRMLLYHFFVLTLPQSFRDNVQRRSAGLPPELPDSFAKFRAGFVESHLSLALGRGTGFSRAAGPGYVRLTKGEQISEVIDLRRQMRRQEVEAVTRDGVPLQTAISLIFRVRRADDDVDPALPYPYGGSSIFRLTYADGMGNESEVPWSERICTQAASLFAAELARYPLDRLFQPGTAGTGDVVSLNQIVADVHQRLDEQLLRLFDCSRAEECPLQILNISVGQLQPPREVVQQRIQKWQQAWERQQAVREAHRAGAEAEGREERSEESRQTRARALAELIESVTEDVEQAIDGDSEALSEMIMLRMTQLLDRLIEDPQVQSQAPQHIVDTVSRASRWLKELPAGERDG